MDLSHNQFSDKGGEFLGQMLGEWPRREGPAEEGNLANDPSLVGAASPVFIVIECSNYESDVNYTRNTF